MIHFEKNVEFYKNVSYNKIVKNNKAKVKKMKKAISIICIIILLPILFINGVILINSWVNPDKIPSFFGWKPFIVLSGSMETEIYSGDIVVVKEVNPYSLKKGDVIAFKSGDVVITHRIVEVENEDGILKYVTKGDNNNTEDRERVLGTDVEGIYKFKISKLGNLAMFIQTPIGMLVCLSIPLLLLIIIQVFENKKNKKYVEEEENKHRKMEKELEELRKQNEELKNK